MKKKAILLSLVFSTGLTVFLTNNETNSSVVSKNNRKTKILNKKEKEVTQIKEVRDVLKKELNEKRADVKLPLKLTQLGTKIDQKTEKLKIVIKKLTDAMLEKNVDKNEIDALEKEFNLLGSELKKEVQLYQKLTWIEMKKLDPYKNELVKEWKRRQGATI